MAECVFFADRSPSRGCYIALCRALLEFCSVTTRWTMHHFPFLSKGRTLGRSVGQVCQLAGVVLQQEPMLSSQESKEMLSQFFFFYVRRRTAIRGGTLRRWAAAWYETWTAVAEWPGVWSQPGSNCISQVPAGFSGALTGFQCSLRKCENCLIVIVSFDCRLTELPKDEYTDDCCCELSFSVTLHSGSRPGQRFQIGLQIIN